MKLTRRASRPRVFCKTLWWEPEHDEGGQPTGFYFVTIGEGRRLAQLLRAKRKKTEAIRCVIDTANDPFEISLDENVILPVDCQSSLNFDPVLEWAPGAGQDQSADLTIGRVYCSSNCTGQM